MGKRSVAFFVSTKNVSHADLSNPLEGNPGIGATQYLFVLIASELKKRFKHKYDILFITDSPCLLPTNLEVLYASDIYDAIDRYQTDLLIIRTPESPAVYEYINKSGRRIITWSHNRIWYRTASMIADCNNIVRNVCVGYKQALEMFGHEVMKKTVVIHNPVPQIHLVERDLEQPIVTYMGHLDKPRGFHFLASQWKQILNSVPNAQLHVIGAANLYDRSLELGRLGVASKSYEKRFLRYIVDDKDVLLPSVFFHGIMGQEKISILRNTMVGVVNPVGYETLSISILEMAACGIPVVSINKYGQSEVVLHNSTGLLFNRKRDFAEYIITLLKNKELNRELGDNAEKFVSQNFNLDKILAMWSKELDSCIMASVSSEDSLMLVYGNKKSYMRKGMFWFKSYVRDLKHFVKASRK